MTERLFDSDSHIFGFKARVVSCENDGGKFAVVLDKTAFFPEGGGQGSDLGFINGIPVSYVSEKDGTVYHLTAEELAPDTEVYCIIDKKRRLRHMQNHTGEHIISGIIHNLYGFDNIGFHLGEDVTADFNGELNREMLNEVERLANQAVYENVDIFCRYPSAEELKVTEYRSKLDLTENVRLVEIEGYDICACCAPHVKKTGEIGIIKILEFEKNKGGTRIYIKCGSDALSDYNDKYRNISEISSLLAAKQTETAEAVKKLTVQLSELKYEISGLKRQLIDEKIKSFSANSDITAVFEEGLDKKELQLYADALCKSHNGIRGVFSKAENSFAFAICGEENELGRFFAEFKSAFTVKGGGKGGIVQGTTEAEKEKIESFFKKH